MFLKGCDSVDYIKMITGFKLDLVETYTICTVLSNKGKEWAGSVT